MILHGKCRYMNMHGADVSMEEFSENEFDRLSQLHPDFDPEQLENALKRILRLFAI